MSELEASRRRIARVDDHELALFKERLRSKFRTATALEDAAQAFTREFYESFVQSTVLARVYITAPFGELPEDVQDAARAVAAGRALDGRLVAETPVLALAGSYGVDPGWRDRRMSRGHAGIPLVDATFVQSIPMVARLLDDLGAELGGLDDHHRLYARKLLGGFIGVFHVADAATTVDSLGRHVIPAQDFVAAHQVKTVFGMGGAFLDGTLAICIAFTRETISRMEAERLAGLIPIFKSITSPLVRAGRLFR